MKWNLCWMAAPLGTLACTSLPQVPSACTLDCFEPKLFFHSWLKMPGTAVCLQRLSSGSVAGLLPWFALVAPEDESLWGFFLCFSLFRFSLMLCCAEGDTESWRTKRVYFLASQEHRAVNFSFSFFFWLELREVFDLNNGFCVLICVGFYPAPWPSWCLSALWADQYKQSERNEIEWLENEDREAGRVNETEEGGKKRRSQKERGSASLLWWFPMKLILIPPEISHCPLSPLHPASITYLSTGWMIYTLPMSTADRYAHQWFPVLRDLACTQKTQRTS